MRRDPLAYLTDELSALKEQKLYRTLRVLEGEPRDRRAQQVAAPHRDGPRQVRAAQHVQIREQRRLARDRRFLDPHAQPTSVGRAATRWLLVLSAGSASRACQPIASQKAAHCVSLTTAKKICCPSAVSNTS